MPGLHGTKIIRRHGCKFPGDSGITGRDATAIQKESNEALDTCMSHPPNTDPEECEGHVTTMTPQRHHSSYHRERVDSAVHYEVQHETSYRNIRDPVERKNTRSHSPDKYYSPHVSVFAKMVNNLSLGVPTCLH